MKLMEHDVVKNREKLERILDSVPIASISKMENILRNAAIKNGVPTDDIDRFLIAGDI